jgi:hypothetical protein
VVLALSVLKNCRVFGIKPAVSVAPPKTDMDRRGCDVRFVPKADIIRRFSDGSDNTERQTDSPLFGVSHQLGQNILNSQQVGCRTKCFVRGAEIFTARGIWNVI